MRRKSARNASKSLDDSKTESPKATRRSSRRRKKSASSSDGEPIIKKPVETVNIEDNSQVPVTPEKGLKDKNEDKRNKSAKEIYEELKVTENNIKEKEPLPEDLINRVEEKKGKGKSKSKGNSKIETSSINVKPETENVQVTAQSPSNDIADNENVENVTANNATEKEGDQGPGDNTASTEYLSISVTVEHKDNNSKDVTVKEIDNQVNPELDQTEKLTAKKSDIEASIDNEKTAVKTKVQTDTVSTAADDENQPSVEEKDMETKPPLETTVNEKISEIKEVEKSKGSPNKKIIKLKRPNSRTLPEELKDQKLESDKQKDCPMKKVDTSNEEPLKEVATSQHNNEINTEKSEEKNDVAPTRRVSLKRRTTVDEKNDTTEGGAPDTISTNLSAPEITQEKKRRLSTTDNKPSPVIPEKILKPSKKIKLNRNIIEDDVSARETFDENSKRDCKWIVNSDYLVHKVDVEFLKSVCPTLEFLPEEEVKLEVTLNEHKQSENENYDRMLEDDHDKDEKQDSEESTNEQKGESDQNIIAINRKISIVDDSASKLRPPPSPASNPTSEILYITNLVRPFTVKQLKELLERTGKIKEDGFWTDRIKSKCYVHYETVEEAEATRNALHGVNWPIGNGKKLNIDYATLEDMEKAQNPPPPVVITKGKSPELENKKSETLDDQEERRDTDEFVREWDLGKREVQRRRSKSRSKSRERVRKHSKRSMTPEDYHRKKAKHEDVPQKLMDDLFLKTKATPSIYWQPLSPEEIAMKQQQRLVRMEEHKKFLEEKENRTSRREIGRRNAFRRR